MDPGPRPFAVYYHRGGPGFPSGGHPLMTGTPPGIHAPAPMRQTLGVAPPVSASFPAENASAVVDNPVSVGPSSGLGMGPGMGMAVGMGGGAIIGGHVAEPVKRKRGRPRKYGPDVNGVGNMALGLSPLSPTSTSSPKEKKGRGSGRKAQLSALGAAGQGFTPHVLTVSAGEDVAMKIMSFLQHGPWAVCILSANGAISNVTLRQPSISGGIVTYEGRYEVLSLTGSFLLTESGGTRTRTGGLSVSLAGADGRVIGGAVAGLLMAASPVQVMLGTFFAENRKNQVRSVGVESQHGVQPAAATAATGGTPSSGPFAHASAADATGLHDHNRRMLGAESQQHSQIAHAMPLQSLDWTAAHFETEARDDTDNMQSSPDYS